MKKKLLVIKLVIASFAMIFNLAACTTNADSSTNELSGKKFGVEYEGGSCLFDFTDDTFALTSDEEPWSPIKYCGDYRIKHEYTYSYSVNSEIGYILAKKMRETVSYERNGTTLYTEPNAIPETLEEYKAERTKLFKALNPSITEEQVAELLNKDPACESVEKFSKWRESEILYEKAEKKFYYTYAYKFEGNKFVLSDEDWRFIPQGLKFGDIFNDSYEYSYSSETPSNSDYPDFEIDVYSGTMKKETANITIRENDAKTEYTILSATNDSMKIAKVTRLIYNEFSGGGTDIEFDESKAFTCPITYTNGENKVTAKITIEGKEYSFDIEYVTKKLISEMLENGDTYILQ